MSGHSGHFLLLEEGRAARAPSEGDSSPETDPFSSAVRPSSRGAPVLTGVTGPPSETVGCTCLVWRERGHRGEAVDPGDPEGFRGNRDLNLRDGCDGPGGLPAVPTISYKLIWDHVWPLS